MEAIDRLTGGIARDAMPDGDLIRITTPATDVGLPGTNGRQFAEMMRERRPDLEVPFVTGDASEAAVRNEFLAMDMVAEPFEIDISACKVGSIPGTSPFHASPPTA
ncbi:MAG: hypothetical protein ACRYGA_17150 [Janthinobacterium lividum]